MKKKMFLFGSLVLALTFASCEKESITSNNSTNTPPAIAVVNETDEFTFGASEMQGYTDSKSYEYVSSGPNHELTIGNQITGGTVGVTITNASGQQLYSSVFSGYSAEVESLNDSTFPWTVSIEFANTIGNTAVVIEKVP